MALSDRSIERRSPARPIGHRMLSPRSARRSPATTPARRRPSRSPLVALFLIAFLIVPLGRVIVVAFTGPDGGFSLVHFGDFFRTSLLREAFWNSIYVAAMTVVLASLIAVPLATILARFRFRGAALIHTLGVVPLVMPPFVGAVAMQLIFGRNGSINLLLNDWFGFRIPFMEGLNGVIFVEALHYFPFILLNLSASLANIDSAMEESAQNLGARGFTLFSRIVFPLAMPGYVAGAALVFVKVFDDLGDAAAAQRHHHAGAAGLSEDHLGRHRRSDGLRDLGDHDRLLARRHAAVRRWCCAAAISPPRSAAAAGCRAAGSAAPATRSPSPSSSSRC